MTPPMMTADIFIGIKIWTLEVRLEFIVYASICDSI